MKKLLLALVLMPLMVLAEVEVVGGIEWTYVIRDGRVQIGSGRKGEPAISTGTNGVSELYVPAFLGGRPVEIIGNTAFGYSLDLMSAILPYGVVEIGGLAFYGCTKLMTVSIPTSVMRIGRNAFERTKLLEDHADGMIVVDHCLIGYKGQCPESLVIPADIRVVAVGALSSCVGLKQITVAAGNPFLKVSNNCVVSVDGTTLCVVPPGCSEVVLPDGIKEVPDSMFCGDLNLQSVTIPSSVTNIGDSAFDSCYNLTAVTMGDGVRRIGAYAFWSCSRLAPLTIPSSVEEFGEELFSYCGSLSAVVFEGNAPRVEEAVYYENGFAGTFYVKRTSSGWDVPIPGVWHQVPIAYFEDQVWTERVDDLLLTYKIVDGKAVLLTMETEAENVVVPSSIGGYAVGGLKDGLFRENAGIKNVSLPSTVTEIGNSVFERCTSLRHVTLPDGILSIGDSAFRECVSLDEVIIPASVTNVGYFAFRECLSLENPVLQCSESVVKAGAFDGTPGRQPGVGGSDGRYVLSTTSIDDSTITSMTVSDDASIESFHLSDGKVLDLAIRIENVAMRTVRIRLPSGYAYETIGGGDPLTLPANSKSMITITRTAEKTFLVTRQELVAVQQ